MATSNLPPEAIAHLRGIRDPGDAWVVAEDGTSYWGRFGAAGLLAYDPEMGILMQHRVAWSDHGGTWGIPGGAINEGESAVAGAVREAHEEAGVPVDAVEPTIAYVSDRGGWSYTTVLATVLVPFTPAITDPESVALEWVPLEQVDHYPLHPGFRASWATLRRVLEAGDGPDLDRLISDLVGEGHVIHRLSSR